MTFQHSFTPNIDLEECMGECTFSLSGNEIRFSMVRSEYMMLVGYVEAILKVAETNLKTALTAMQIPAFPNSACIPDEYHIMSEGKVRTSDYIKDGERWRHPARFDYTTTGSKVTDYTCVIRKRP